MGIDLGALRGGRRLRANRLRPSAARRRPWDAVSWWYSLLFVIPVVLIAGQLVVRALDRGENRLAVVVTDAYTGQPLPGAAVTVGNQTAATDAAGRVRLDRPASGGAVSLTLPGYAPAAATLPAEGASLSLALRPTTLRGSAVDAASNAPLPGVGVVAVGPDGRPGPSATTAADGGFSLVDVPAGATLRIEAGDYGSLSQPVGQQTRLDLRLKRAVVTGRVTNAAGQAIQGALVRSGQQLTVSGGDGAYRLGGINDGAELVVSAPGYKDVTLRVPAGGATDARLERVDIKAIYASVFTLGDPVAVDRLIALIDRTELNALVVDIKQDTINYDSQVAFFRNAGTVKPVFDAGALVAKLKQHGIYAIARLVAFQDPLVAEARPDLAVKDETTGQLWRNMNGVAWVNAFNQELWQANIDLAVEAAGLGFDEIQYDYVRFPSDGNLRTADFGRDYSAAAREGAINEFLKRSHAALQPTGAKLAADIFGYTALTNDDQGIGQRFAAIVPLVDYVCLMLYPSHFTLGNITSAPGEPNDYPYETIKESLARGGEQIPAADKLKLRPWLQGFSLPGMKPYGAAEIRAQIRAAEEFGTSGWLIWDPTNKYADADAFGPKT